MARLALRFPATTGPVPPKSIVASSPSIAMLTAIGEPSSMKSVHPWRPSGSRASAARIFPPHLSYQNPAVGGPERGPYTLDESNIDWGQDLPALAAWQRENPSAEPLQLFYFGTAEPSAYGVRALAFDASRVEDPPDGTVAISAHYLAGLRKLEALTGADADWLTRYEPVAKAGYSIFIYRFPAETAQPPSP